MFIRLRSNSIGYCLYRCQSTSVSGGKGLVHDSYRCIPTKRFWLIVAERRHMATQIWGYIGAKAPSLYSNQSWLIISCALWHSLQDNFTGNVQDSDFWYGIKNHKFNITAASARDQWVNPGCAEFLWENTKSHLQFSSFLLTEMTFSIWKLSSWKTLTRSSYMFNAMAADGLATQGTRTLAAIVLIKFSSNIPISAPESLIYLSCASPLYDISMA